MKTGSLFQLLAALCLPMTGFAQTAPAAAAPTPSVGTPSPSPKPAAPVSKAASSSVEETRPDAALISPPKSPSITTPAAPAASKPAVKAPLPPAVPKVAGMPAPTTAPSAPPAIVTLHVAGTDPQIAQAESRALADGQTRAFEQIVRARDPERAAGILKKVTDADRAILLKTVSAQNEMRRAGRYEADVTYAFDAEKIALLLDESKGLVPELSNDALLVLPAYDTGTALLLFEPQNQWRELFNAASIEQGRGRLIVPFGDPRDRLMIDATAAATADRPKLAEMARRYGAGNMVIATAKFSDQAPRHTVAVALRRPGEPAENATSKLYTQNGPGEKDDALLMRAARETASSLRDGAGRFSLFAPPDAMKLKGKVLRAEYATSREWTTLRDQMKSLPGVEFTDIGAITAGSAQLTLYYRGDLSPIRQALEGRGLKVADTGNFWTVRLH